MNALVKNIKNYDKLEFRASKLYSKEAVLFLKRQSDGLLSTGQAYYWVREIARLFPDSKLALPIDQLKDPIPLTRKRRRLLQNKQYEMLLSFTFNK